MHKAFLVPALIITLLTTCQAQVAPSTSKGAAAEPAAGGEHVRYASDYNWKQAPRFPDVLRAGPNTITLSPCPRGLTVTDQDIKVPRQYVYIAGAGRAEPWIP